MIDLHSHLHSHLHFHLHPHLHFHLRLSISNTRILRPHFSNFAPRGPQGPRIISIPPLILRESTHPPTAAYIIPRGERSGIPPGDNTLRALRYPCHYYLPLLSIQRQRQRHIRWSQVFPSTHSATSLNYEFLNSMFISLLVLARALFRSLRVESIMLVGWQRKY